MSMDIEVRVFLAYAFAVLMVYVFGRFFLVPLKWLILCVCSSFIGGIAIVLINYFGAVWGIFVPLNIITSIVAGCLGIPGVIMMIMFF